MGGMNQGGLVMAARKTTPAKPKPLTVKDVTTGLKMIAYWNEILADMMSRPEVRMCKLGDIGDFSKGNLGGWPPIAEWNACRPRCPIPSGEFVLGEAGEVLYALSACTGSIAAVVGRLPRGMDLTAPPKPVPRPSKRPTAAGRARTGRTAASKRPAARKRAPAKRTKRSK
jgi:hypothetical protein